MPVGVPTVSPTGVSIGLPARISIIVDAKAVGVIICIAAIVAVAVAVFDAFVFVFIVVSVARDILVAVFPVAIIKIRSIITVISGAN